MRKDFPMITLNTSYKSHPLTLTAIPMGNDWNISIFGGDKPHIGAIAIGVPRPSLENPDIISSSVSVIAIIGHKEDMLMRQVAEKLSRKLNAIVSVSGGIHLDTIESHDFVGIASAVDSLCDDFLKTISSPNY
ncbi:MAG: hypothetical protein AB9856_07425 [Cellulosilyticaceae bacterium]